MCDLKMKANDNLEATFTEILDNAVEFHHQTNSDHDSSYKRCNCFRSDFGDWLYAYFDKLE